MSAPRRSECAARTVNGHPMVGLGLPTVIQLPLPAVRRVDSDAQPAIHTGTLHG